MFLIRDEDGPLQHEYDYFMHLSYICYEMWRKRPWACRFSQAPLMDWSKECYGVDPRLEVRLFAPARTLGIPDRVVVSMLRNAVAGGLRVSRKSHVSSFTFLRRFGFEMLATRLWTDRDLLFDILLPSTRTTLREALVAKNEFLRKPWFEFLNASGDYELNHHAWLYLDYYEGTSSLSHTLGPIKACLGLVWRFPSARKITRILAQDGGRPETGERGKGKIPGYRGAPRSGIVD